MSRARNYWRLFHGRQSPRQQAPRQPCRHRTTSGRLLDGLPAQQAANSNSHPRTELAKRCSGACHSLQAHAQNAPSYSTLSWQAPRGTFLTYVYFSHLAPDRQPNFRTSRSRRHRATVLGESLPYWAAHFAASSRCTLRCRKYSNQYHPDVGASAHAPADRATPGTPRAAMPGTLAGPITTRIADPVLADSDHREAVGAPAEADCHRRRDQRQPRPNGALGQLANRAGRLPAVPCRCWIRGPRHRAVANQVCCHTPHLGRGCSALSRTHRYLRGIYRNTCGCDSVHRARLIRLRPQNTVLASGWPAWRPGGQPGVRVARKRIFEWRSQTSDNQGGLYAR